MNKTEKFWNKLSVNYSGEIKDTDHITKKILTLTTKYLKDSDVLLDFGCGPGTFSNVLSQYVDTIHAIDISSGMIESGKSYAAKKNIHNIHYLHTTIYDEGYAKNSFDVIIAFNILHHLTDLDDVLMRIMELLKPGGLFISSTACMGEKITATGLFLKIACKVGLVPKIRYYKISELNKKILSCHLEIVESEQLTQKSAEYFIVAQK